MMKLRILNAGHAMIAYPSALLDIHFVHEGMEHPLVRAYLRKMELEEVVPIVPSVPGMEPSAYFEIIERRFANPKIGDTMKRLCFDGSNRQPKFIIPSIADRPSAACRSRASRSNPRSGAATAPAPASPARRSSRTIRSGTG